MDGFHLAVSIKLNAFISSCSTLFSQNKHNISLKQAKFLAELQENEQ